MVKTVASHAINIGSNPVRVTSSSQAAYPSHLSKLECTIILLLIASAHDRCAGSFAVKKKALDKWKKRSIIVMFSGRPEYGYTEQKPSEADFVRRGDTAE